MRNLDFSSWQALLSTLFGLVVISLVVVGIRLLVMQTVQQRRERENRQINERLRTLIAAYKTLGGSFTGDLAVDPTHLRDVRDQEEQAASTDRSRRIRDAVEAALSDVVLLGTEEQVRLAAHAAADLVAGRPTHTDELVVSLRDFIRQVLDLQPVPAGSAIPRQGPTRVTGARAGKGESERDGTKQGSGRGGSGAGAGAGAGAGIGAGVGLGSGAALHDADEEAPR
jgi:heme exporter protein D